MKLKPTEEVLLKMLRVTFMNDLKSGRLTAGDQVTWILRDEELIKLHFEKWLIARGYAE